MCYFSGPCAVHLLCLCVKFLGTLRRPTIVPLWLISRAPAQPIYCASVSNFLVPCATHLLSLCVLFLGTLRPPSIVPLVLFLGPLRRPSIVPLCLICRAPAPTIYCASVCHFSGPCAAHLLCLCVSFLGSLRYPSIEPLCLISWSPAPPI